MKILFVHDQDSYKSLWVDGVKQFSDSDDVMIEDILHMFENIINQAGGVKEVTVNTFSLDVNASTSDIPDYVNDVDSLKSWHLEFTGEEISDGW